MNKNITNFLFLIVMFALIQWVLFRPQVKQPAPVPQPSVTILPAGLVVHSPDAQAHFKIAIAKLMQGDASPASQSSKYYNEAASELEKIQKEEQNVSGDSITAGLLLARIQWHHLNNDVLATTTLSNIRILRPHISPSLQVSVFDGSHWTVHPAIDAVEQMYAAVVTAVNHQNAGKFGYQFIAFFVGVCAWAGPYKDAVALIMLGALVTILLTPIRNWQYRSMGKVTKLQPHMKKLQDQYKGQPEELNRKMMELYKEHGANPLSGCLPMLVPLPFMYWLYYAIRLYQFKFNGSFLWIGSHFAHAHSGWATPKGPIFAMDLGHMDVPLLLMYAGSMYFYAKFMPVTTADPEQQRQSLRMNMIMSLVFMPIMFYMYAWPSAFILWWLAMNVTQTLVTVFYLRHHPALREMFARVGVETDSAASTSVVQRASAPSATAAVKSKTPAGVNGAAESSSGDAMVSTGSEAGDGPRRIEPRNRRKARKARF